MSASFAQWQARDYPGGDAPFRVAEVAGPQPYFHDALDAARTAWRSTPEATFPDGYLGTINSRRHDRLFDGLKQRTTNKPYSRGIHKGERRDPSDYIWPEEFNPWTGIERELEGVRFAPPGLTLELGESLVNDGKPSLSNRPTIKGTPSRNGMISWNDPEADNPDRVAELRRLGPPWASRGGPGMALGQGVGVVR